MDENKENELVLRVQRKKDEEALTVLYNKYLPLIYGFLLKRLGSRVQAEDLTSQTFLEMVKCIEEFEFKSSFKNWLFGIAKNILRSNWTSHYKMKEVELNEFLNLTDQEEFIVDEKIEVDIDPWEKERQTLPEVLKLLPEHYREVIKYRFLKELSIKETAQKMGLSENYIKVLQYRAVKKAAKEAGKQGILNKETKVNAEHNVKLVSTPLATSSRA